MVMVMMMMGISSGNFKVYAKLVQLPRTLNCSILSFAWKFETYIDVYICYSFGICLLMTAADIYCVEFIFFCMVAVLTLNQLCFQGQQ